MKTTNPIKTPYIEAKFVEVEAGFVEGTKIQTGDSLCWYIDCDTGEKRIIKSDLHEPNCYAGEDLKGPVVSVDLETGLVSNKKENEMRTLKNTEKKINLGSIAREIDFKDICEVRQFLFFTEWLKKQRVLDWTHLSIDKQSALWKEWLCDSPGIQRWLEDKGFAEWVEPESVPLVLEMKDEESELLWHRLNIQEEGPMNEGGFTLYKSSHLVHHPINKDYLLVDLFLRLDTIMRERRKENENSKVPI